MKREIGRFLDRLFLATHCRALIQGRIDALRPQIQAAWSAEYREKTGGFEGCERRSRAVDRIDHQWQRLKRRGWARN